MKFPHDFLFGAASAAYQIEGAEDLTSKTIETKVLDLHVL
nr:family 1 glycosylhydrolase [Risungbinella massiliensis]